VIWPRAKGLLLVFTFFFVTKGILNVSQSAAKVIYNIDATWPQPWMASISLAFSPLISNPPPPWFFTFSAFPFLYYLTDAANEAEMKAPSPFSLLKSETPKTLIERGAHAAYAQ